MAAVLRLLTVVLLAGTIVHFAARSLRVWLAAALLGLSVLLLLPDPRPWSPLVGAAVTLVGAVGLVRGSVQLWRRPRDLA